MRSWPILDCIAANWPATLFFFSTLHHPHRPSRELVCNKWSLQCFYVNRGWHILDRHSGVTLVVNQFFKNITLILLTFKPLLLCLQGYRVRKGCSTWRDLTIIFLNKIILDEIIENHILKSREVRVNITSALCAPARSGYICTAPWLYPLLVILPRHWQIPELATSLRPLRFDIRSIRPALLRPTPFLFPFEAVHCMRLLLCQHGSQRVVIPHFLTFLQ